MAKNLILVQLVSEHVWKLLFRFSLLSFLAMFDNKRLFLLYFAAIYFESIFYHCMHTAQNLSDFFRPFCTETYTVLFVRRRSWRNRKTGYISMSQTVFVQYLQITLLISKYKLKKEV